MKKGARDLMTSVGRMSARRTCGVVLDKDVQSVLLVTLIRSTKIP